MRIIRHEITNFRNIAHADLELSETVNIFYGINGEGKTNFLESMYLLSGAKSFRKSSDRDLIKDDTEAALINTRFFGFGREQTEKLSISSGGRTVSLNRGQEEPASRMAGKFLCSVFSPEHLSLVKGSPNLRRKFLDSLLCQIYPGYIATMRLYSRLVIQKNALLKDVKTVPAAYDMMEVFDSQLASEGTKITKARAVLCTELLDKFREHYRTISSGREEVSFSYRSTLFPNGEDITEENALSGIKAGLADDIRTGIFRIGPHRDDILMTIDGRDMRIYASQGQQRSTVLALKMTEADYIEKKTGEKPILLLDDVMSELDSSRQDRMIDMMEGTQTVMTCCDPGSIKERTGARMFHVEAGEATACT